MPGNLLLTASKYSLLLPALSNSPSLGVTVKAMQEPQSPDPDGYQLSPGGIEHVGPALEEDETLG